MRIRLNPWLFLTLLAAAVGVIVFGIHFYRFRFVRTNADLLRFLPQSHATIFFANVALLRHAGLLSVLAGGAEDLEYKKFVQQTQFDYRRDIDAVAAAADHQSFFILVRGHFDSSRLRQYAALHGGFCDENLCRMSTSVAGRWVSFFPVQPDVLALAVTRDPSGVAALKPLGHSISQPLPLEPIWMRVSQAVLENPADLPPPLRIFAISMQAANPVMLSLSPANTQSGAAFNLRLDALCPREATAETIRNQLQIQTKLLKLELAREHRQPNPADLTGLLTSGSFQVVGNSVVGVWPVSRELIKTLQ